MLVHALPRCTRSLSPTFGLGKAITTVLHAKVAGTAKKPLKIVIDITREVNA